MDTEYTKRILKELELFPPWKLKDRHIVEPLLKEEAQPIETDLFFVFRIKYVEGSLLLLSQNFALEKEEAAQDLFLKYCKVYFNNDRSRYVPEKSFINTH